MIYNKKCLLRASKRALIIAQSIIAKHGRITNEEFYKYISDYKPEFKNEEFVKKHILNRLNRKGKIILVPANRTLDGKSFVKTNYPPNTLAWIIPPKFESVYKKANEFNTKDFTVDPRMDLLENELKLALKITVNPKVNKLEKELEKQLEKKLKRKLKKDLKIKE